MFQVTCIGNNPYFKSFKSLDDLFCFNLGGIPWNMPEEGRRAKWRVEGGGGGYSLTWPIQGSHTKQGMGFSLAALTRVTTLYIILCKLA